MCVNACTYACMYVCTGVCLYVCAYRCVFVSLCVCPGSCAQLCLPRKGHAQREAWGRGQERVLVHWYVTESYTDPKNLSFEGQSRETEGKEEKLGYCKAAQGGDFNASEGGCENRGLFSEGKQIEPCALQLRGPGEAASVRGLLTVHRKLTRLFFSNIYFCASEAFYILHTPFFFFSFLFFPEEL